MLFLEGVHRQSRNGEIAVDAAVEGLEAEIRGQAWRETQLDGAIHGAEFRILPRILAEGHFDGAIDGMGGPGTGNVGHFDVAVDVPHQKISVDVADHDVPFVDSLDFDVDVARNTQLKIDLDDVALEFTMPAPVVAMAAKGTIDVELQRALLLGDVEGDVLAGLFELVFGFCAGGFVGGELHLVRICAYYFDGTPDVVNFQRFMWGT